MFFVIFAVGPRGEAEADATALAADPAAALQAADAAHLARVIRSHWAIVWAIT